MLEGLRPPLTSGRAYPSSLSAFSHPVTPRSSSENRRADEHEPFPQRELTTVAFDLAEVQAKASAELRAEVDG